MSNEFLDRLGWVLLITAIILLGIGVSLVHGAGYGCLASSAGCLFAAFISGVRHIT
jgi:hypothetical protein